MYDKNTNHGKKHLSKRIKQHNALGCEYSPGLIPSPNKSKNQKTSGFTIVELLVVIVVIGILAAITIVSYTGITKKANEATVQAELANASKKLAIYYAQNGSYPTNDLVSNGGCPSTPVADTQNCVKFGSGISYTYIFKTASTYDLTATKGTVSYKVSDGGSPQVASASPTNCPTGFVLVPGSATYGTSNFCVMKYEAKADDNGDGVGDTNQTTSYNTWPADAYPISASRKLVSTPGGYPVANISQTTAITAASSFTKDCTGCHLISEAEWMTIAQNVLGVNTNWNTNTVGSGYIFSGHNDAVPNTALVADANDTLGYSGTSNSSGDATVSNGMVGNTQRRTLALSNGNVIWDLAGNTYEWTSGQVSSAIQPGVAGNAYSAWLDYPSVTTPGSLPVNVTPAGTGISGAGSWTSANGIGQLLSNPSDTVLRGFLRGGSWNLTSFTGVLCLNLGNTPSVTFGTLGFRVAAPAF